MEGTEIRPKKKTRTASIRKWRTTIAALYSTRNEEDKTKYLRKIN